MGSPVVDEIGGDRSSIYDVRLSTVVPASVTGEGKTYQFTDIDLAMKLHYITTVHFYGADAVEGMGIHDFKKPMFQWLQCCYPICGRIRRLESVGGRPFIKCNDSGVRIVEAKCSKTVAEWLESGGDHHRLLVYHQPILANDFGFTPLVFLQLTKFKCGGLCVGMRWAHVLGDAFSASQCIHLWGQIMANQTVLPSHPSDIVRDANFPAPLSSSSSCHSIKLLDPSLGDNWLMPNNSKLQTHTFHLTQHHLTGLYHRHHCHHQMAITPFELISAILWKSLAKIRGTKAKIVTVCKKGAWFDQGSIVGSVVLGNTHQAIGVVEAETLSAITDGDVVELARMIGEKVVDETGLIERFVTGEDGNGNADCVVYGSNLTFVSLEEVDVHGLRINGRRPVYGGVRIGGIGDGGAVMVGPDAAEENGGGRSVSVVLPEDEVVFLKNEMRHVWGSS